MGVVVAVVAALAWRRPVLFRMASRNALRRRAQSVVVVLGLMVGTAIISGSLATGDSLAYAIRQGAYDGLGPADVFVAIEGQLPFPESVADRLAADPEVRAATRALSPLVFQEAAASNPRERQSEPNVAVVGFDPARDEPFGLFTLQDGRRTNGADLADDGVFVLESLAEKLALRVGDTLALRYSEVQTPVLPRVYAFNGTLAAGAAACPAPPLPPAPLPVALPCEHANAPVTPAEFTVPVRPGAVRATVVLTWYGPQAAASDLDPVLVSPSGARHLNANGSVGSPDIPAVLNVTLPDGARQLEPGEWTLRVGAKAAADQPFTATALVFYEVYDLAELRNITRELEAQGFDADRFEEFAGGGDGFGVSRANFTVQGIVRPEGKGDFLLGQNVFMRLDRAQALYGMDGRVSLVQVSIDGDPVTGVARSDEATATLEAALARVRADAPDDPAVRQVSVREIKQGWIENADEAGTLFKSFLATIGSFTIIAGVMLIVNIFVMLAEERKSELGMARAVGLKRRQLVLLFGFEGALYALAAAVLGALLGLALAFGLIVGFNSIFASRDGAIITSFPFHPEPASVAWAFAAGFFLTLATVLLASHRVSKLNVVRAIRRIEEPRMPATRRVVVGGLALFAAGALGTAQGVVADALPLLVLAPCLALIGLAMVLSRWFDRRVVYPVAGAVTAAYATWTIFRLPSPEGLLNQLMGPARGVIIVVAVVLIVVHVPQLVPLTKRLLLRFRALVPAVKPGIAYPLEKKARTGLTIAMFALVILVVVAFSTFGATFTVDVEAQGGGYDVEGDATVPVKDLRAYYEENVRGRPGVPDPFARVARFDELRYGRAFGGDLITIEGREVQYQGPPVDYVYAYDEAFADANDFAFESTHPDYPDARAAYRAVLRDPSLVIISALYNFDEAGQPGAYRPGDTLTLHTSGGAEVDFTIIGIQKQFYLGGIWVHPEVLEANFQRVRGEYLFELKQGEDPAAAARDIEAAFEDLGMDAVSIREAAAEELEVNRRFFSLFQLFLAFGLVVGIASLGIVTARSVIERRQEIGMLRAIGYGRRDVLRIFLVEILFTTTLGVVIGTGIGLLISYGVVASTDALAELGVAFTVPWGDIGLILALTYAAVVVCTFLPARAASRVSPAEAIRYVE